MTIWKTLPAVSAEPVPVLFLDRDGVVIQDRDYLADPQGVELTPGAAEAMARARQAGFLLVGMSNQSGLGRGRFTEDQLASVMERLDELLEAAGVPFDAFYYCPHAPEDNCDCRKPGTGLLAEASHSFRWDPARSWMVGDKASDILFARNANLGGVLVRTGHGGKHVDEVAARWGHEKRVGIADDLTAAVDWILDLSRGSTR